MNMNASHTKPTPSGAFGFRGPRLGSVFGIDIYADYSLLFIFALIAFNLIFGLLPRLHPEWSALLTSLVALAAATLFFVSIALHELSHAVVGRHYGMPIRRITLFVFGGVAHLEGEPSSPGVEFRMALVGPLTSLVIGALCVWGGVALSQHSLDAVGIHEVVNAARNIGPVATLLLWLGPLNLALGVFNLVPGFPLDGGRVLRAGLWAATGDLSKATRWAAGLGQAFGALLIAAGFVMIFGVRIPLLGVGFGAGIWAALIGWFLGNAARASLQQTLLYQELIDVPVHAIMRDRVEAVSADLSLDALVRDYLMNRDQTSFLVEKEGALVGLIRLEDLRGVPRERWVELTVEQVMVPRAHLKSVHPDDSAIEALRTLAEQDPLPVVDERRGLVGVTRRDDVFKWLMLHARDARTA